MNKDKKNFIKVWDNLWNWDVYANENLRIFKNKDKLRILKEMGLNFKSGQVILDGGCGDGQALITFIKEFNVRGYGIDISEVALKKAKQNAQKNNTKLDLLQGDARFLPYEDEKFNGVLSFGVIEHSLHFEEFIREIFRVLKKGGFAVLIQPHKYSFGVLYRKILQWQGKWPCGFQFEFSGRSLGEYMTKNGFSNYKYRIEGPYKDMPKVYPFDHLIRFFYKGWGHYLYLIATK